MIGLGIGEKLLHEAVGTADLGILTIHDGLGNLPGDPAVLLIGHVLILVLAFQLDEGWVVVVHSDAVLAAEFHTLYFIIVS